MWRAFADDGDDDEWVDPEEEREQREFAVLWMWREGMLHKLATSASGPERLAARRLIAEAKRIAAREELWWACRTAPTLGMISV